jgi:hypothetical protein
LKLLSEKKKIINFKKMITSNVANILVLTIIMTFCFMSVNCFADDALASAKNLLSKAATAGGGLWAVWGLVQLGIAIKDHNGPGMSGAIWQIVGGAVIVAAATVISNIDLTMT